MRQLPVVEPDFAARREPRPGSARHPGVQGLLVTETPGTALGTPPRAPAPAARPAVTHDNPARASGPSGQPFRPGGGHGADATAATRLLARIVTLARP